MYNVIQVGSKFLIRRVEQHGPRPMRPMLRHASEKDGTRISFWTGEGWSLDITKAKEFDRLLDAAVCHPPE